MTRECIHGIPRTQCRYCSKLNDILNQNTISERKLMRLIEAVGHSSITNANVRVSQLQEYPHIPISISNRMRQATRNLINAPRNRAVRERFENAAMNQVIRAEFSLEGPYSPGTTITPSRSGLSVYNRLGTPRDRRARSMTPTSTPRVHPRSPGSNENNMNGFSPPRKKSK